MSRRNDAAEEFRPAGPAVHLTWGWQPKEGAKPDSAPERDGKVSQLRTADGHGTPYGPYNAMWDAQEDGVDHGGARHGCHEQ